MKRRIALITVLLCLGAAVNIAVAWGCALLSTTAVTRFPSSEHFDHPKFGNAVGVVEFKARGHTTIRIDYVVVAPHTSEVMVFRDESGLPFRSMAGGYVYSGAAGGSMVTSMYWPFEVRPPSPYYLVPEKVPLRPILPGFLINTIFYALLLWLLFFAAFCARRLIRRRHGLCEQCAYPIGTSPVCTECGAAVTRQRKAEA